MEQKLKQHRKNLDLAPTRGNRVSHWFFENLFHGTGWKFVNQLPNIPKAVIIAAPHTSNQDAWPALTVLLGLGIKVNVMAKDSLFRPPFKSVMKWLGLMPVNRNLPGDIIQQSVDLFNSHDKLWLGVSPDGTRKGADKWKSGFYRIALAANVPIVIASFDFKHKTVHVLNTFYPTGDYDADLELILSFYDHKFSAKRPEFLSKPLQSRAES